jgi:hypothetical protein
MTIIRIRQNNFGCWLVIIGDTLTASFLTHNRALDYARGVKP